MRAVTTQRQTVTIASGATKSEVIDIGDATLVGVHFPAAFTGTGVTIYAHDDLDDAGVATDKVATKAVGTVVTVSDVAPRLISLVSSGAEGADRSLTIYAK